MLSYAVFSLAKSTFSVCMTVFECQTRGAMGDLAMFDFVSESFLLAEYL